MIHEICPEIQKHEVSTKRPIHEISAELCSEFRQKFMIVVVNDDN